MERASIAQACEVLGISENASAPEVNKAYRELARIHHPDKSACPQATDKFKQIHAAYEFVTSEQWTWLAPPAEQVVATEQPSTEPSTTTM